MKSSLIFLISSFISIFASEGIDQKLQNYIQEFHFTVPQKDSVKVVPLFELGRQLFHSKSLSLANDISCAHCHHPQRGSGDGLPLALGTGADGEILTRTQGKAGVTKRHSPALWNRSLKSIHTLFWDGRVSVKKDAHGRRYFVSPSKYLSGLDVILKEVALMLDNTAALQSVFPPTSAVEMRGEGYDGIDDDILWELICENVVHHSPGDLRQLFELAYPGIGKIHIGHLARALAHFQEHEFFVNDTPWDDYLNGQTKALSLEEKQGALIFMEKAKCADCHFGANLTSQKFENILISDMGNGSAPNDMGRFEVTKNPADKYKFIVPGLRNVALSPPYMHNGALLSLEDVIEHYDHPMRTLMHYNPQKLNQKFERFYHEDFVVNTDRDIVRQQWETRSSLLPMNLGLSDDEKSALLLFLKKSLTSKR